MKWEAIEFETSDGDLYALVRVVDDSKSLWVVRDSSGIAVDHGICATVEGAQGAAERAMEAADRSGTQPHRA